LKTNEKKKSCVKHHVNNAEQKKVDKGCARSLS